MDHFLAPAELMSRYGNALLRHHRHHPCNHYPITVICDRSSKLNLRKNLLSSSASSSSSSSPSSTSPTRPPSLPIAAFVDLDNVAPKTFRRSDARSFVDPLIEFGRRVNNSNATTTTSSHCTTYAEPNTNNQRLATTLRIEAFGNLSTRSWRGINEGGQQHTSTTTTTTAAHQEFIPWNGTVAQTGFDKSGTLRCGVCNKKITLDDNNNNNKKKNTKGTHSTMNKYNHNDDNNNNHTVLLFQKLQKHMKIHHDEHTRRLAKMERKRITPRKKSQMMLNQPKPPLPEKELVKYRRYQSAQVGLNKLFRHLDDDNVSSSRRRTVSSSSSSSSRSSKRNDLFQILREVGIKVMPRDNVDNALIDSAKRWMKEIDLGRRKKRKEKKQRMMTMMKKKKILGDDNQQKQMQQQHQQQQEEDGCNDNGGSPNGVLIVYSKDADFVPLLDQARRKGYITVSATDTPMQTAGLLRSSDVVIGPFGKKWWHYADSSSPSSAAVENDADAISLMNGRSDDDDDDNDDNSAMQALSVSSLGFHFMSERVGPVVGACNGVYKNGDDDENSSVRWYLSHGLSGEGNDVDDDDVIRDDGITKAEDNNNANDKMEKENAVDDDDVSNKTKEEMIDDPQQTILDKRIKKRKQIYECKGCGERMKVWGALRKHMQMCKGCTRSIRKMPRKQHVVYLDGIGGMQELEEVDEDLPLREEEEEEEEEEHNDAVSFADSVDGCNDQEGSCNQHEGCCPDPIEDDGDQRNDEHGIHHAVYPDSVDRDDGDENNVDQEKQILDSTPEFQCFESSEPVNVTMERALEGVNVNEAVKNSNEQESHASYQTIHDEQDKYEQARQQHMQMNYDIENQIIERARSMPPEIRGPFLQKHFGKTFSHMTKKQRREKLKSLQRYECTGCGERTKHWAGFLDHMRQCEHFTKADVRRIGRENLRKKYAVYVDLEVEEEEERTGGRASIVEST